MKARRVLPLFPRKLLKGTAMSGGTLSNKLTGAVLCLGLGLAIPGKADQLIVDVVGIERMGGAMMVAVFNSPEGWEDSLGPVATAKDSVAGPKVRLVFQDLAPGPYAVKLYHDENANGELDTNMLGIPSEGYGFSNYKRMLGEPDFEESMFMVDGETTIEITLN
ncbi:DUF2141 domain-containing protein [Congregibacter sp.]|uniref:DUF2141 domain-containing protein n=1 Tax=Congregibacter sp. TaxID=2744308 RepID=UPI003F6A9049